MIKLLIDENLPQKIKFRFGANYNVFSVHDMGWASKQNGELLKLITFEKFDVFLTADRNIEYQQNLSTLEFILVILELPNNRYETVLPYVVQITKALENFKDKCIRL